MMKKFVSVLLVVMLCIGSFGVYAADVPSFMEKMYSSYTADYKISMKINNANEIVGFLNELEVEHLDKFVDVKALIESLLDVSSVLNVQAEISEDFRKITVAVTTETNQNIVFNKNYETSYLAKMGMWVKIDIDKKELLIIYSTPLNEKYAVIDLAKDAPAEIIDEIFGLYDKMFCREIMEKHNKEIVKIAAEHAEISLKGKTATLHYDNDAFIALIDDTIEYMKKFYSEMSVTVDGEPMIFPEIPSLKGLRLLGKEGITCTYQLSGDNITSISEKWDISIGLADIFSAITGAPWEYVFSGDINITFEYSGNVSKIGTTKVSMPVLTEENSFNLTELFGSLNNSVDYIEEEAIPYISMYVWGETDTDTFDGERYYMPVRSCIEEAYADNCVITYDKGAVTIVTNTGIEGRDINASFKVGEDKATVNGTVYEGIGAFRMINSSVYASVDFYEKCLGWNLEYFQKDLLNGCLYYEFYTEDYEEYVY